MVDDRNNSKSRRRRGKLDEKPESKPPKQVPDGKKPSTSSYHPHTSLLIQLNEKEPTWYQCCKQQVERDATMSTESPTLEQKQLNASLVSKYRSMADEIFAAEIQLFAKMNNSKDDRWVEATMKKGTLKDRIAAMSVAISTDPVHKFYVLTNLLQLAGCNENGHQKMNSRVAQMAAEALQDLFLNTYMPRKRKLFTLAQRPLYLYENIQTTASSSPSTKSSSGKKNVKTKQTLSPRILLLWRFEELVKQKYDLFLRQYLTSTLHEGIEIQKIAAIRLATTLLRSVPEGESTLLPIIVNKLGDPGKKEAAIAAHELRRVLRAHPAMQTVVAREVQQLAHRPHLAPRALYNCIVFLNQLHLTTEVDSSKTSLAASLMSTYFGLFEVATREQKGNKKEGKSSEDGIKTRLLSALLTGVNRAHPYLPKHDETMERHIDSLYRLVHIASPAARVQALLLLFHMAVGARIDESMLDSVQSSDLKDDEVARRNRFYRALYATVSEPDMLSSGRHLTMYFNLLYKSMKYDTDMNRVGAFAKRLMATTLHGTSGVIAASLFLLNEISKVHPMLLASFTELIDNVDDVKRFLDASKREPRWALVTSPHEKVDDNNHRIRRAAGWELSLVLHHYHPSVRKFASTMGDDIPYTGDPLRDFALAPFLDKFAYRNPKTTTTKQPRVLTQRKMSSPASQPAVNDPNFWQRQTNPNPEDEFFVRFFTERSRRDELKGIDRYKKLTRKAKSADGKYDDMDGEEEAFTSAEDADFGKYESQWQYDSDEEDFVDSLAEKLMRDSGDGPADLDDEDPDMDGWDDLRSHDDGEEEEGDEDKEQSDTEDGLEALQDEEEEEEDDDDDAPHGNESGDSNSQEANLDDDDAEDPKGDDVDAFMDEESSSEAGDSDGENGFESNDDMFTEKIALAKRDGNKKKKAIRSVFVDAEDYEEAIQKSWTEMKRYRPPELVEDNEASHLVATSPTKKRRKGKRL